MRSFCRSSLTQKNGQSAADRGNAAKITKRLKFQSTYSNKNFKSRFGKAREDRVEFMMQTIPRFIHVFSL